MTREVYLISNVFTGLMVYSVETVQYLLQEARADGVDTERSDYSIPATTQKFWVTAIR